MEKLRSYSFWVGLVSGLLLVVKFVAESFGFSIPEDNINSIVNSVLSILTILGVINKPPKKESDTNTEDIEENTDIDK